VILLLAVISPPVMLLAFISPPTSNRADGVIVPMPTLALDGQLTGGVGECRRNPEGWRNQCMAWSLVAAD
jgi:hypothetical protein